MKIRILIVAVVIGLILAFQMNSFACSLGFMGGKSKLSSYGAKSNCDTSISTRNQTNTNKSNILSSIFSSISRFGGSGSSNNTHINTNNSNNSTNINNNTNINSNTNINNSYTNIQNSITINNTSSSILPSIFIGNNFNITSVLNITNIVRHDIDNTTNGTVKFGNTYITINFNETKTSFSWSSNQEVVAIYVNAGECGNVYKLDAKSCSGTNMIAPASQNGQVLSIKSVEFYFNNITINNSESSKQTTIINSDSTQEINVKSKYNKSGKLKYECTKPHNTDASGSGNTNTTNPPTNTTAAPTAASTSTQAVTSSQSATTTPSPEVSASSTDTTNGGSTVVSNSPSASVIPTVTSSTTVKSLPSAGESSPLGYVLAGLVLLLAGFGLLKYLKMKNFHW